MPFFYFATLTGDIENRSERQQRCTSDCLAHLSLLILFASCVCSAYQVVVEEERPRRARGTAEILRCYPVPIHFQNATVLNSQYYFTAQFPAAGIHSPQPFTVGDNKTYNGYWNAPLLPQKSYSVYYQAVSTANGVGVSHMCFIPTIFVALKLYRGYKCVIMWSGAFMECHGIFHKRTILKYIQYAACFPVKYICSLIQI